MFFLLILLVCILTGIMVRVFANGPRDLGSIPGWVIPKTQKMLLDVSLLNTQHNKVRIKGTVTYWPSTEPSIKRCTYVGWQRNSGNRCIRSKISEYYLDLWTWFNSGQMRTPTESRWMSNNYITRCHRQLESVGVPVPVPAGDKMLGWEPEELWVNMWQSVSVSNSPLTHKKHHPCWIKCERYIFIKKCVRFVRWSRHYVSAYISMYMSIQQYVEQSSERSNTRSYTLVL